MSKENEELLNMGMGILKHADASKLESVNVDVTKRPDGSRRIAISWFILKNRKRKQMDSCTVH